jgi:periplasmic copper chaperone A
MRRLLFALGLAAPVAAGSATAHETKHNNLTIIHPWVHETEAPDAILHVKIKNTGGGGERLVRASSPLAAKVAVLDPDGKKTRGLSIAGRGEFSVQKGGAQIVLSGITKPLRAYDTFDVTLVFEKAGAIKVQVTVEEAAQPAGG